ncbi:MAG: heme-binding protein [Deltaproteobacteria bacterium]|nr:heme-binding protein [Deltaproteobacteria bacterium]
MRSLVTLDHADAQRALTVMREVLVREQAAAVIAVADAHGDVIALERLDGASPSSITIAMNKAWTAAREGVRTYDVGQRIKGPKDDAFDIAYYGDPRYIGWGGGVPVIVDGRVVGSIAVSGLPELEDQRVADIGVAAILASE